MAYHLRAPRPAQAASLLLDQAQQQVVAHSSGPLLVLAGPGTGKTATIVESVAARIREGIDPASILVLTFSRKAALALRDELAHRLAGSAVPPTAITFHSFCHRVVRTCLPAERPLRLLTAPEQDARVRDLLQGWEQRWPADLAQATSTRGFVGELRTVMARVRQLGLDPQDLERLGRQAGRAEWVTAAQFMEEYLTVTDFEGVLDYAELAHRTAILLSDPATVGRWRCGISHVYVDEYQDTDPAQVRVLSRLVGAGGNIVAVGDPDQSIYSFRGGSPRAMADFGQVFGSSATAPVITLRHDHRHAVRVAQATATLATRLAVPGGLTREQAEALRTPIPMTSTPGSVEVWTAESEEAQAEWIADTIRRARLEDGVAWQDMAVLVRSGRAQIPALARTLQAAGVPVEVAGDEIPLAAEPAVIPLLLMMKVASGMVPLEGDVAPRLLMGPLARVDAIALRRLARTARRHVPELEHLGLGDVLAGLLRSPETTRTLPASAAVTATAALGNLLAATTTAVQNGEGPHEVLWAIWAGTDWPRRLAADASGGREARAAHRDLDAVVALFSMAMRRDEDWNRGVRSFIADVEHQQIPGDIHRDVAARGAGMRILTAHRAKGLEWPLVIVAGVQEGVWPSVRRRSTLLEADRLTPTGLGEPDPASVLVTEDRRLFYVACTRARERLIVTAVEGHEGEADQPSRFLAELGVPCTRHLGRPERPLTMAGLVGEMRRVAVNPASTPELRHVAIQRLAGLATLQDAQGRPVVPAANPDRWWGLRQILDATTGPSMDPEAPVRLTGSSLESLLTCPRAWFLQRRVRAESVRSSSASLGSVVHAIADHAAREGWTAEMMHARLDAVWERIPFEAAWFSASERAAADAALDRFSAWHEDAGRELLDTERRFSCEVEVPGDRVLLEGVVDRLERDDEGRLVIVDLKTKRTAYTAAEVSGSPQLGLYQLAVTAGAFPEGTRCGGAEFVLVNVGAKDDDSRPRVQTQASLDATGSDWILALVGEAAATLRAGEFPALAGVQCARCLFADSCPATGAGRQVVE